MKEFPVSKCFGLLISHRKKWCESKTNVSIAINSFWCFHFSCCSFCYFWSENYSTAVYSQGKVSITGASNQIQFCSHEVYSIGTSLSWLGELFLGPWMSSLTSYCNSQRLQPGNHSLPLLRGRRILSPLTLLPVIDTKNVLLSVSKQVNNTLTETTIGSLISLLVTSWTLPSS